MKTVNDFKVEDTVKWSSQANGRWCTKVGIIVEVVPCGARPVGVRRIGGARKCKSYVVAVPVYPDSLTTDFEFYWPIPTILHTAGKAASLGSWHGRLVS